MAGSLTVLLDPIINISQLMGSICTNNYEK